MKMVSTYGVTHAPFKGNQKRAADILHLNIESARRQLREARDQLVDAKADLHSAQQNIGLLDRKINVLHGRVTEVRKEHGEIVRAARHLLTMTEAARQAEARRVGAQEHLREITDLAPWEDDMEMLDG